MKNQKLPFPLGPSLPEGVSPVEILERKTIYHDFLHLEQFTVTTRRFDGSKTEAYSRRILTTGESGCAAIILPYDPVQDKVVLIEQFRMAAHVAGRPSAWLVEPVAGLIAQGDTPEETAHREMLEECGRPAKRLEKVATCMPSPGCFTEVIHLFVAQVDAGLGGEVNGLEHEHENIRSHVMPADEAIALNNAQAFDNGPLVTLLFWLAHNKASLRERWLAE